MVHANHLRVVLFLFVAPLKCFTHTVRVCTTSLDSTSLSRRFVSRQIFRNQIIDAVVSTLFKVETTGLI